MCVFASSALTPVPSGGWGPFVDLLGPAEGKAGSGPRVRRSSCAGLQSSRLPISRLPSVRPSPFPNAGLGVRGGEAGPPRGRVIAVLLPPHPPSPSQSPVRAGDPRVVRPAALPPSFSEGWSVGLTPPLVAGCCFCTFVCGGSPPRGGEPSPGREPRPPRPRAGEVGSPGVLEKLLT